VTVLSRGDVRYDVDAIKRAYPLADVVAASGVELRRGPRGGFWALCPFHEERTPSFLVDTRDNHFHCFGGCRREDRHGDVITFVMRREGLSFPEACARLAGGPVPPKACATAGQTASGRERRWERLTLEEQLVLNTVVTLYREAYWRSQAARAYVRGRGIPDWVARTCGLGYADGRSLEPYLRRHGGLRIAEALGLLRPTEAGEGGRPLREFFAGRVVVPELRGGQPIWLIGRPLAGNTEARVKYLALPGERPVLGFERAAGRREVYLTEGVFDWLTALSWRLPAFCACGTDMPLDRLGWLARARVVFGVLDPDGAGREAAERFEQILGPRWRPLSLPDGADLNDLGTRPGGRAEFFRLVEAARGEHMSSPQPARLEWTVALDRSSLRLLQLCVSWLREASCAPEIQAQLARAGRQLERARPACTAPSTRSPRASRQ
jgi:DNA primase